MSKHIGQYRVKTVTDAKVIASHYLISIQLEQVVGFGLPEVDDRYHVWRVPLKSRNQETLGEVVIDAITSLLVEDKTSSKDILEARLLGRSLRIKSPQVGECVPKISTLRNTIACGDAETLLREFPAESVDLIFTSPPYFNARPEYACYIEYETYLLKMRKIIHECHRVLSEGRFFAINIAPVLQRRAHRNESSKRIAVPFDFHRLFIEEHFEFIDDIVWVKPEGAGWATGRGRRFAADRHPLQYKTVPVTEYILVYRKCTDKLIDWHIRKHPDQQRVVASKIADDYERTNVWKIHPAYHRKHPAVFPLELAERIIKYYSFKKDVVLDPFGGIGTTAKAAFIHERRFVHVEISEHYIEYLKEELESWFVDDFKMINWINTYPPQKQQAGLTF